MNTEILRMLHAVALAIATTATPDSTAVVRDSSAISHVRASCSPVEHEVVLPPYFVVRYLVCTRGGVEVRAQSSQGEEIHGRLFTQAGMPLDMSVGFSDVVLLRSMQPGTHRYELINPSGRTVRVGVRETDLAVAHP